MFNGRLKITVIAAAELQETNFMKRLQLTESAPPVQLDPYVAIDVDEVNDRLHDVYVSVVLYEHLLKKLHRCPSPCQSRVLNPVLFDCY